MGIVYHRGQPVVDHHASTAPQYRYYCSVRGRSKSAPPMIVFTNRLCRARFKAPPAVFPPEGETYRGPFRHLCKYRGPSPLPSLPAKAPPPSLPLLPPPPKASPGPIAALMSGVASSSAAQPAFPKKAPPPRPRTFWSPIRSGQCIFARLGSTGELVTTFSAAWAMLTNPYTISDAEHTISLHVGRRARIAYIGRNTLGPFRPDQILVRLVILEGTDTIWVVCTD